MEKRKKFRTLKDGILLLQEEAKSRPISIGKILRILPGKGHPLILILLSLPFCQPLQIPGLSIPFGLTIAFVALRMVIGKSVLLPKKLLAKKIPTHTLNMILEKADRTLRKIQHLIHPRLSWACRFSVMQTINGMVILILGLLLALPLPIPFSNLIAAWPIFLMALGILEDDGVFVLLGYLGFLFTLAFFIGIALGISAR